MREGSSFTPLPPLTPALSLLSRRDLQRVLELPTFVNNRSISGFRGHPTLFTILSSFHSAEESLIACGQLRLRTDKMVWLPLLSCTAFGRSVEPRSSADVLPDQPPKPYHPSRLHSQSPTVSSCIALPPRYLMSSS
jgi:hypothetical protein